MIAATVLAVFFVPVFYVVMQGLDEFLARRRRPSTSPSPTPSPAADGHGAPVPVTAEGRSH
jgi:hypothetical protein